MRKVTQLIEAAPNLLYRTILMILYGTGLRRAEVVRLKVDDIDSQRMVIRVHQGKGALDRDVHMSPKLLAALRDYWRWNKPKDFLFPSSPGHRGLEQQTSDKTVWHACQTAAKRAGLRKRIGPHTLRHASAYYTTFQSLFILKAIALGQSQSTAVYGHYVRLALPLAQLAS